VALSPEVEAWTGCAAVRAKMTPTSGRSRRIMFRTVPVGSPLSRRVPMLRESLVTLDGRKPMPFYRSERRVPSPNLIVQAKSFARVSFALQKVGGLF